MAVVVLCLVDPSDTDASVCAPLLLLHADAGRLPDIVQLLCLAHEQTATRGTGVLFG